MLFFDFLFRATYDIALLHLEYDISFNKDVQPAQLPQKGFQPSGDAVLSGWGTIQNAPNPYTPPIKPLKLHAANVSILEWKGETLIIIFFYSPFTLFIYTINNI